MSQQDNPNEYPPSKPYMNPYLAGVLLGLTLLASYLVLGVGLGASGGLARLSAEVRGCITAPAEGSYFGQWGRQPMRYYLVFMFVGTLLGGLGSALAAGRIRPQIERGARASRGLRITLAIVGGVLTGFASRLASGCTSGQALSGGAMLLSGSLLFLVCIFAGGYATAWLVGRQWHD